MALCTVVVSTQSGQFLAPASGVDPSACPGPVVLSASEYTNWQALLTAFGFDASLFGLAFGGGLVVFVTGLGIGLAVSQVRKLRI
ncbi:MAG TPA: hypothetical protein VFF03_13505 [Rhodocyclaceae bacterium]|nr:hypothetical protein [Rhodocyclaceae bacterium]